MQSALNEISGPSRQNAIRFFGASLDALDIQEAVDVKKAYLGAVLSGKCPQPDFRDPFELVRKVVGDRIMESGHQYLGRFMVDSWLTPKPKESDFNLVGVENYGWFLRNGGFKVFAELVKEFVEAHVFPYVPGMVGVDHSLSGGALMALSERLGPENLGVLVFDVHTDAVPLAIRSGLVEYWFQKGVPSPAPISEPAGFDPYSAGSFLFQLIEQKKILPCNLTLVGPGDSPDKLRHLHDKRVVEYVRHYDSLLERGMKIVTNDQLQEYGPEVIRKILDELKCRNLYISLDVDVSAQCGVLATRFIDLAGTDTSLILKAISSVGELLSSERFSLAGLDIMEIDIHKIGAKLRNGMEDRTGDFIRSFLSIIIPNQR